ncbi:MFS transporter [Qipengyuania sp. DSG2-2]|uniref:MFS transporter n=1 Tax=Qipengyuania sp. DGS2-2 TaxID=3349631 RepID=UPI0036D3CD88
MSVSDQPAPEASQPQGLSRRSEFALAAITGATVANAYYIHPIIADIGPDFGAGAAQIGLVPAANQIALALGIFLLLPLGDRYPARQLSLVLSAAQAASLFLMAWAESFALFVAGSTLLGFFTIVPYLMPSYASKRVSPDKLGSVTATLTAGIIVGILIARVGAGIIAEYVDWRVVYWIAGAIMVGVTLAVPLFLEPRRAQPDPAKRQPYWSLVFSTLTLMREYPLVIRSGIIQALNFGIFLSVWLALAFHLTSDAMGYGTDTVGYLAGISVVSIFATPALGRWADRVGAYKARFWLAVAQAAGIALLWPLGDSLWLLLIPLSVMNLVGPSVDVTGRMTFLALDADIRTRLMTGYIILMFTGAGIASWAAPVSYELAGWGGTALLVGAMSLGIVALSWTGMRGTGSAD